MWARRSGLGFRGLGFKGSGILQDDSATYIYRVRCGLRNGLMLPKSDNPVKPHTVKTPNSDSVFERLFLDFSTPGLRSAHPLEASEQQ